MKEKFLNKTAVFKGKVFTVYRAEVELPDKKTAERELIDHNGGVCIYAQIDDEVLMVRQYRIAIESEMLELPAGKLEKDEEPLLAAGRELREETGYQAAKLNYLGYFIPTCGYSNEKIYLYRAEELTFVGQHLDPSEFLKVVRVKLPELKGMLEKGEITDGKTLVLLAKTGI